MSATSSHSSQALRGERPQRERTGLLLVVAGLGAWAAWLSLGCVPVGELSQGSRSERDRDRQGKSSASGRDQAERADELPTEEALLRRLDEQERTLGRESVEVACSLHQLAELYHAQGKYAAAKRLYQQALAILERVDGPHSPDVANVLNDFAEMLVPCGDYARVEAYY